MSFTMVEEKGVIRVTMFGVLTRQDLAEIQVAAELIEDGRDRVPHRLADLRAVTEVQIRYPDVHRLAEARRTRTFPNSFKSAIVVGNAVQAGMARMFRTLNDNPQISLEVFEDEAAAIAWLRK